MIEQLQHAFNHAAQLTEAHQALLAEFIQEKIADLETEMEPDEPMVWNTSSGRDPLADPRQQTFEEFFRELGVSDEEIDGMRALMEEEEAE